VQQLEIELAVGETVQVGSQLVTLIEVDGGEISVRIDPVDFDGLTFCEAADAFPRK
jgi:hypothetical protein